jgi:hypothetical protein
MAASPIHSPIQGLGDGPTLLAGPNGALMAPTPVNGGMSPGAPKGHKNAFTHGCYTAEALANRREIAALLRTMRTLPRATGEGE